jgi:hypothetical protein
MIDINTAFYAKYTAMGNDPEIEALGSTIIHMATSSRTLVVEL